ncbi:MAG: hypothetical protein LBE35_01260 [Clostridiales bacterium]|nr:hypothetical protein [Clostridiales bacterium]
MFKSEITKTRFWFILLLANFAIAMSAGWTIWSRVAVIAHAALVLWLVIRQIWGGRRV